MSGTLRGRELVNPSIMQSAPEVNQNTHACCSARLGLCCRFSVTALSSFLYLLVGGCQRQRQLQEEREGEEFGRRQRERRPRQFAAPGQRAAGDVRWRLVPQHAPAVGIAAGHRHQEVSSLAKKLEVKPPRFGLIDFFYSLCASLQGGGENVVHVPPGSSLDRCCSQESQPSGDRRGGGDISSHLQKR